MRSHYRHTLLILFPFLLLLPGIATAQAERPFGRETTISPGIWGEIPAGFVDYSVGMLHLVSPPYAMLLPDRNSSTGGYVVLPIRVFNKGTGSLRIEPNMDAPAAGILLLNGSDSDAGSINIPPGEGATLRLIVLHERTGPISGRVVLRTSDPRMPVVRLPIVRINPPSEASGNLQPQSGAADPVQRLE